MSVREPDFERVREVRTTSVIHTP